MPVEWRQNEEYVALILQVPSVVSDTVDAKFQPRRLEIKFRSEPVAGGKRQQHSLVLALAGEVAPAECRYDAADNNMMVVLKKAQKSGVPWPDLEDAAAEPAPAATAPSPPPKRVEPAPSYQANYDEPPVKAADLAVARGAEEKAAAPPPPPKAKAAEKAAEPPPPKAKAEYDKLLFELD